MENPWIIEPLDLILRLILAVVLGGAIGIEREQKNHAAGLRTHILVSLAASLIMLLSIYGFNEFVDEENVRIDPARMAAQVVTGIGFLGAGVILYNGATITGLTTAASLWTVAAIGLSVGAGFYIPAVLTTGLAIFALFILKKIEQRWFKPGIDCKLQIKLLNEEMPTDEIMKILEPVTTDPKRIVCKFIQRKTNEGHVRLLDIIFIAKEKDFATLSELVDRLYGIEGVLEVEAE